MMRREITDQGVCVVTFDRPDSSINLFDRATLEALNEEIDFIAAGGGLRGAVFVSAKPRVFVAGADLKSVATTTDPAEIESYIELGQTVFTRVTKLKIPTVAAIHGACVGGGYEFALACDWRIATPDKSTTIGLPEVSLGLLPAWGGSTRLPRLIGVPKALDLILHGRVVPARQALAAGLVDKLAPHEHLLDAAFKTITEGGKPRRRLSRAGMSAVNPIVGAAIEPHMHDKVLKETHGHYPAAAMAVQVVTHSGGASNEAESLRRERVGILKLVQGNECQNLVRLFFLKERARKLTLEDFPSLFPPDDARKAAGQPPEITHAAVIGAGVMGAGIAQWLAIHGCHVILRDIDAGRVGAGMRRITRLFEQAVHRGILDERQAQRAMDRISPTAVEVPLHRVQMVIEAAVEKLPEKKEIFTTLGHRTREDAILATNTSALSISQIAGAAQKPERVIGIHFFNPVHKMKLVEVVVGQNTSPLTAMTALRFVQSIGKLPVLVKNSPGFLVNRILVPYLGEAARLFEHGAAVDRIDKCMVDFGMPVGPLQLIDEVGADVAVEVGQTLSEAFGDRMQLPESVSKLARVGWFGKKTGRGFYVYDDVHPPKVNEELQRPKTNGGRHAELPAEELTRRMILLIINEAARCLEEGIVPAPYDVDLAMVYGTGFAPFRGGPLATADKVGIESVVKTLETFAASDGPHFEPCELLKKMADEGRSFHEYPAPPAPADG